MDKKEMLDMELNEVKQVASYTNTKVSVIRVLGGWLYITNNWHMNGCSVHSVFVPEESR